MCLSAKLPTTKHNHTRARSSRTPGARGAGWPLTSADALQGGGAGPEVALQPLGVVAGLRSAAVLVQLLGADLAAAAAVGHQPHARGALRRGGRALAHGGAGRAQSLRSGAERAVSAGSRRRHPPASSPSLPLRTAAGPAALTRRARQRRAAARAGRVPAEPMSSAGAERAV